MMDEKLPAECYHQAKKSKLSEDHDCTEMIMDSTVTKSDKQLSSSSKLKLDKSSESLSDDTMQEDPVKDVPNATVSEGVNCSEAEPTNMTVEDDIVASGTGESTVEDLPAMIENPISTPEVRFPALTMFDMPPWSEEEVSSGNVEPRTDELRPRNRFRGRNYRLRSDSVESANEHGEENNQDFEAIVRRLVDEINNENASDDDENENNEDDGSDENSTDTSSADSDDSDSSLPISDDDDDDDDDNGSTDNESDNNANEHVDVSNLPFMQTSNVKSNWNYFREIQLRSFGLSYHKKASIGGVRYNSNQFQSRAYGSKHIVERLTLQHQLSKHGSCVNSLNFNSSGTLLASGSDDLKINLWNWQNGKLVQSIASEHRMNIFQTKFFEASGYRNEIKIISTGRDGQVRLTRVGHAGEIERTILFKQSQPIHKIAIPARSQFEFLTACEDGLVKSFDLRDNVVKKVTKTKQRLYSIATHPFDHEFCVSGNDESVRVYDRRNTSKPMKVHYAHHTKSDKQRFTVTCAVYNNLGTEILASYSDEDVFLFDNVQHEDGKYIHRYTGHCNRKTIKGVNFFGPNSEFIVSGSDCGNIFFWDKETEIIVNWMKGDHAGVVNCLEPHPEFPIMATSGLDHDVKIWVPKGSDDEKDPPVFSREALKKCVQKNLRIRQSSRSLSDDRILDFLMFRQGLASGIGRFQHQTSSDSEDQADGAGSAGGGEPRSRRRTNSEEVVLRCNPS
ncbi:DDB1- and CUL4-associated factor 8 [Sabethes cyaneus]|uniref:DDB1- and CUL4-associated factor 8 n=1 Tax=Sabethes cyaneus TaxID=53552 RepID=UPI00237D5F52|nr:DDB1- and CUL4-associated factor 8 [Sabethes cyaneus]